MKPLCGEITNIMFDQGLRSWCARNHTARKILAWPRQDCFTEARHVHVEMAELIKLRQRQEE